MRLVLLIVLLLCPLTSMAEMRCGTLGHSIIRFDSKYTFLPESYEGVSYWGGEGWKNRTKGCLDRLASVTFAVDWPSLESSRNGTYFTNSSPDRIAFTYEPNASADPAWSLQHILSGRLSDDVGEPTKRLAELRQLATFNSDLGLYAIRMPQRAPHHFLEGYWEESGDSNIRTIISCRRYTTKASSSCVQDFVDIERGIWIQIDFYFDRLPDWQAMRGRSIDFLKQFVVKEI